MLLTVGAVSKTIRVNMLYSCASRNCITWKETLKVSREAKNKNKKIKNLLNICHLQCGKQK